MTEPQIAAGVDLFAYSVLGSTNDEAKRLAEAGVRGPLAIWAAEQPRGRGRSGRNWAGRRGNLMVSLLLHPQRASAEAGSLALAAGLAVSDCARAWGKEARLKWPNDVLIGEAKLAGILLEAGSQGGRLDWIALGIGLNLAEAPALGRPTACIGADMPVETALEQVIAAVLRRYRQWFEGGFPALRDEWLERAAWLGRPVRVGEGPCALEGIMRGVDPDGSLVVCDGAGVERRLVAGEVAPLEV